MYKTTNHQPRRPRGGTYAWRLALPWLLAVSIQPCAAQPGDMDELLDMDIQQLLQQRITGSQLLRASPSRAGSPITLIQRSDIARSGVKSLEALLQRLPLSAGYAGNQSNAYWGVNGNGSTHVNLRGLGINRTLVLLNGQRLAPGGTGANAAVDLNSIPLALVERIEIFRDGASTAYGADAVAGVVNIITRERLNGSELQLDYGQTSQGDGAEQAASLSWGRTGEDGWLLLNLSHQQNAAINMASRAGCGLGEVNGALACVDSGNTIGGRGVLADGQRVNFNQVPGGDGDFYETYDPRKHNFNANPYLNAVNPLERYQLSALGAIELAEQLQLRGELNYTRRDSEQLASPGTLGANAPIAIAADHPSNPTGQDLLLQRRRLLEAGARSFYQEVDYLHGLLGLDGRLGSWHWSSNLHSNRNWGTDGWTNLARLDRVAQTLDTNLCSNAANAAIPCADYLGYGDLSPQVLDYLMVDTRDKGGNRLYGFNASARGPLLELPAGQVQLALGLELRREKGWRTPDPLTQSGLANINRQEPVSGQLEAREAFVEAELPLTSAQAWSGAIQLNAALRGSHYDLFGGNTTHKLALNWQPHPSLAIHLSRAEAFRAPNIPELYAGALLQSLITSDPCSHWSQLPSNSPIYQNCLAAGVPANYQQLATSIPTTLGGNRDLQPEEARNYHLGFDWRPGFAPGVSLGLSLFHIDIDSAIVSIDGTSKLPACYTSSGLSHPFCGGSHFTRNPQTGDINFLSTRWINAATEEMQGLDLELEWQFDLGAWRSQLRWHSSYLDTYELQPFSGATTSQMAGKVTSGRGSYLRWRSLASLELERGPWSGSYSLQYLDRGQDASASPGNLGYRQPSISYHYLQLGYQLAEGLHLRGGIDNLWNKRPPFVRSWLDVNTDTMTYDVAGRRWYLGLNYLW